MGTGAAVPAGRRWAVRGSMLLLVGWWAASLLWAKAHTEPYPALMMPPFGGSFGPSDGDIRLVFPTIDVYRPGGLIDTITPSELLREFAPGSRALVMTKVYRPDPGASTNRFADDPALHEWLRGRLAGADGEPPERVEVRWVEHLFAPQRRSAGPASTREVSRLVVDLRAPSRAGGRG